MLRFLSAIVIVVGLAFMCPAAIAQDAQKKPVPDFPPAPQQVPAPPAVVSPVIVLPDMPRPGTREQWGYYGVDGLGRFRARVILSPYGSYYLYNLQPYPWVNSRATAFMPFATD